MTDSLLTDACQRYPQSSAECLGQDEACRLTNETFKNQKTIVSARFNFLTLFEVKILYNCFPLVHDKQCFKLKSIYF